MDECIHLIPTAQCVFCNGRVERERKAGERVEYRFRAKAFGRVSCGHEVEEGDLLARLGNGNLACEDCAVRYRVR